MVQEVIEDAGHLCIFLPKYHCELNFIEFFWGAVKRYLREHCDYSFNTLKVNMPLALSSVSVQTIRRWEHRMKRWMQAYRVERPQFRPRTPFGTERVERNARSRSPFPESGSRTERPFPRPKKPEKSRTVTFYGNRSRSERGTGRNEAFPFPFHPERDARSVLRSANSAENGTGRDWGHSSHNDMRHEHYLKLVQ